MARHRSPRGRGAHQLPLVVAPGRRRTGAGALRSVPTPLRRGAAAVAVTGSAFSLVGGASPELEPEPAPRPDPEVVPVAQARPATADELVVVPAVEPVDPEPELVDAAELVKAVQLAEQEAQRVAERAAAEAQAAQERAVAEAAQAVEAQAARGPADCGLDTGGLGRVKSHVRTAAAQLGCRFGEPDMHGVAGRAGTSDHPHGLALDFMVDRATGDALAACALENMDALGIKYVIWEQAINHGNGWKRMEDRGGDTANHFDHVHISFDRSGGGGPLRGC